MNDPALNGIHLTKDYYKDFLPTDLQWDVTKVDDDFTLYDLFRLVHHAELMIPNIAATMGMLKFRAFWDKIQLSPDPDETMEIEYLELYWSPSYDVRTTPRTGKPTDQSKSGILPLENMNCWDNHKICEMPNIMSLHGVGPGCQSAHFGDHTCNDDCTDNITYGVEFTPINDLANLPIRVSPKVNFFPPYVESDREFHRTGFQLTIEPTLWCFITSVFWELTFVGSDPNEVAKKSDNLQQIMDDIKGQMGKEHQDEDDNNPGIS